MRVLIFPTDTGQGHNYASQAVKEYLDSKGVETLILDVLNSGKKNRSKFVSKMYDGMVNRVPLLFGMLYGIGELISSSRRHSPIYLLNSLYARSLHKKIIQLDPQVVVCPHMFSAHAVTRLIEKYGFKIPTVGIITDYTCSPFWEETKLDCYIVANSAVAAECTAKGMDKSKLFELGIPVSKKFKIKHAKPEARAAFGITKDKAVALMGGSMGYGRIPQIARELVKKMPDAQVVAVCGSNRKAFEKAKKLQGVIALQYINNVDVLMDAVDIFMTKPGGLSVTEAMTKRAPTVITLPIPGGEERNSEFIAGMGMAVSADTVKAAVCEACRLMSDPDACARMIEAQKKYCNLNAAEDAGDLIIKLAGKTE